jgi:plastocyanin
VRELVVLIVTALMVPAVAQARTWSVSIVDFAFNPSTVNAGQNDTVTWTNNGAISHSSTSNTGIWDSGILGPGSGFSRAFTSSGSFPYHCSVHPSMTGTVNVAPTSVSDEDGMILVPSSLGLNVSPNPFRLSAGIRYVSRGSRPASLEVLGIDGGMIRTLEPAMGRARWDGTDSEGRQVQAGVYFIRLSQNGNHNYARLVKLQ